MEPSRFPKVEWHEAAESVSRCMFAIETLESAGSGFVISIIRPKNESSPQTHGIIIGTAWHVISDLYGKGQRSDLRLIRWKDKIDIVELCENIAIFPVLDESYDCGVLVCTSQKELFDSGDLLPFMPNDVMLARGAQVGWLGFPGLVSPELCFFNGYVSGYNSEPPAYLIDGVAINGVSGGPVFDSRKHVVGFVSAYIPNRLNQDLVLPGLSSIIPISIILRYLEGNLGVRRI